MSTLSPPPFRISWFMWGLGALFYLVAFFQRVAPAVMTEELMRDFQISAAGLGNLSAFYFYSYVAMQIPTGILADTWGPRRLLSAGAMVAGFGTILFAASPILFWANAGRLLIGGSVAVAFVGLLKLTADWFPPRHFAAVTGMALFFGIIGAVSAGPPLRVLMNLFDWRSIMLAAAAVTLAIGAMIWIFVRDHPGDKGYANLIAPEAHLPEDPGLGRLVRKVGRVFTYRNTVLLFFIPGGIVGCTLTFAGLWGVPYLATQYSMSVARASGLTSALMVAWAAGGPVMGWLSDLHGKRKPLYILCCALCLTGWSFLFFVPDLSFGALLGVLLFTGFCSGCMVVSFAFVKESMPLNLAGTATGVINMGVMIGPMILQPAVGLILDRNWAGQIEGGIRIYSRQAYQHGFCLMLGWLALSLILLFFTRETHCRQQESHPKFLTAS